MEVLFVNNCTSLLLQFLSPDMFQYMKVIKPLVSHFSHWLFKIFSCPQ